MTAATKVKKETWLDWMHELAPGIPEPKRLLTREQFIEKLTDLGVTADEGTLRFWEYHGVIPRPIRRWDPEARTSKVFYPYWLLSTLDLLRELQTSGIALSDLAPILRDTAESDIRYWQVMEEGDELDARLRREHPDLAFPSWDRFSDIAMIREPTFRRLVLWKAPSLQATMDDLLKFYQRLVGPEGTQIRVEIYNDKNQPIKEVWRSESINPGITTNNGNES